ncbi:MAG: SDR family NAD(P)-dependent oxidoreductase [Pseudomonadota bacterium]
MDLGISSKTAIVCASSRGLGKACAISLAREGVHVFINGRTEGALHDCRQEIIESGGEATAVLADVSSKAGREALLDACPAPDILINNNGGPDPVGFLESSPEDWQAAIGANMMAPIFMIQAVLPGMRERQFGRIVNITSAMVKTPNPIMCLSSATRTALTALSKAVSKDSVYSNVTLNNLLPEMFDTGRQHDNAELISALTGITYDEARDRLKSRVTAGRFGQAPEFGDACAFLCSVQASFICGQNLQLDGGSYDGLL